MVLDEPHTIEAETVRELDLVEGIRERPLIVAVLPGARYLVFVEQPESHGIPLDRGWRAKCNITM